MPVCVSLCLWRRCIYILSTVGLLRDCPCARLFEVQSQTCLKGELCNSGASLLVYVCCPRHSSPWSFQVHVAFETRDGEKLVLDSIAKKKG